MESKMENPLYKNYYQKIREKIKKRAYRNYTKYEEGEIYLSFMIANDGNLKAVKIFKDKSIALANATYKNSYIQKQLIECAEKVYWEEHEKITIGRVMQALLNKEIPHAYEARRQRKDLVIFYFTTGADEEISKLNVGIPWKLTKENGQECTDDDQTEKTIDSLLKIFTNE